MKNDDRISPEVATIDQSPPPDHLRMLPHHQPPDMRKEETPLRVVRIRVGFGVFVVNPVIPNPVEHRILKMKFGELV